MIFFQKIIAEKVPLFLSFASFNFHISKNICDLINLTNQTRFPITMLVNIKRASVARRAVIK